MRAFAAIVASTSLACATLHSQADLSRTAFSQYAAVFEKQYAGTEEADKAFVCWHGKFLRVFVHSFLVPCHFLISILPR